MIRHSLAMPEVVDISRVCACSISLVSVFTSGATRLCLQ